MSSHSNNISAWSNLLNQRNIEETHADRLSGPSNHSSSHVKVNYVFEQTPLGSTVCWMFQTGNSIPQLTGLWILINKLPRDYEKEDFYLALNKIEEFLTVHPETINDRCYWNVTPLHSAAGMNCRPFVELLLKFNPDPTMQNCFGQTPAERARSYAKNEEIARLIEDYQANRWATNALK